MTQYRLIFNDHIYQYSANALRRRIATILKRPNLESFTLIFSSEGGSTDEGLALYKFLRALPIELHIHGSGHVGRIAVPVFLAAQKRTCSPFSRFLFHPNDWRFDGSQIRDHIAEPIQRADNEIGFLREIVEARANIPREILDTLYESAPTIISPEKAKRWGIVHDILHLDDQGSLQSKVEVCTADW